jgi:NTE family protein
MRTEQEVEAPAAEISEWRRRLQGRLSTLMPARADDDAPKLPSILEVVATSINIMQVRVTRSRMAGDPPDAVVAPRLAHLGLLDFHRAREAIEVGERAVEAALPSLDALFKPAR